VKTPPRIPGLRAPTARPPIGLPITWSRIGDTLGTVRVLNEAEYESLPPEVRPVHAEHFPGLGWVVAAR
jgi:hypothetical protein